MTTFAHRFEQSALKLNELMCSVKPESAYIYADGRNMQPWFSAPCLFEQPADSVFMATHPGGAPTGEEPPYQQTEHDCVVEDCDARRFNSWLDEPWGDPPGEAQNQVAVLNAFKAMFGDANGESVLRDTPCFEVCPLRISRTRDLPDDVWIASMSWSAGVLEHLRPKTIICNGNQADWHSPWSAVKRIYGVEETASRPLSPGATLRQGIVLSGELKGSQVIGIPSLSRYGTGKVFDALREVGAELGLR